ncbi:MAG: bifunctional DNA-formamidopyrimidine glycosylase/DNA-(apurinic or apyrimidinic site) lyase [Patescibacteria group bacterium]|jgi:formamidopyrimidine-DNA glycosylase
MPEMPEVETIARDLAFSLIGQKIESVKILSAKTVSQSETFFKKNLVGRKIIKVARRGKLLIFSLSPARRQSPDYLLIHLKMTGQLIYLNRRTKIVGGHSLNSNRRTNDNSLAAAVGGELPNKYTRALLGFKPSGQLFFNDLRKFGYLKLVTGVELERLLKNNYGPEPLSPAFSRSVFQTILKNRTTKIKALLLNQKLIAGLGNIYVDESLWAARINPERPAGSLNLEEIKKLWQAINRIIRQAIKERGTTFSNYVDSKGQRGNFSRFLRVYGRQGKKCSNCQNLLLKKKVAGRGTHYCPHCQK